MSSVRQISDDIKSVITNLETLRRNNLNSSSEQYNTENFTT